MKTKLLYFSPNLKSVEKTVCAKCGVSNGGLKRFRFVCKGNITQYCCSFCIQKLNGPAEALAWLNQRIEFQQDYYFKVAANE